MQRSRLDWRSQLLPSRADWESARRVLSQFCMRANRAALLLVMGSVLSAMSASAESAAERREREEARWVPSAALFSMGIPDKRSASSISDTLSPQEGDSTGFPWSVGVGVDLASPVIADVAGRPRLFAHGDVSFSFDSQEPVVSFGDPGLPPQSIGGANASIEGIENVGTAVRVEAKPLVLSGGMGVVFSFEAFDRAYRVRPSLEWMYRRDTMKAVLGGGENEIAGSSCGPCRTLFIGVEREKGYHSLGPGIELEVDAARAGDFLVGFFGSFRAYRILGDRKADLIAAGAWRRTDGQPTARADTVFRARYDREPWHYRFGFGFRLLWSPE